jgi:hypothetical protein
MVINVSEKYAASILRVRGITTQENTIDKFRAMSNSNSF